MDIAGRTIVGSHNGANGILFIERFSDTYPYAQVQAGYADNDVGVQLWLNSRDSTGAIKTGLVVDTTGNVGIGTASPITVLDVVGDLSGTALVNQTFSNIKKNGGFESGDASGWAAAGAISSTSHSGTYSWRMNAGTSHCNEYTYEDINVKANTNYSLSAWIKTISETANTYAFFACTNWSNFGFSATTTGTTDWAQRTIENWNSGACTAMRVGFTKQYCDSSGDSYLDDLMVTEGYAPKRYSARPILDSYQGNQWILGGNVGIGTR